MRIGLLTQFPDSGSSSRLITAIRSQGHEAIAINYLRCHITMAADALQVVERGQVIPRLHAIIPRISASATFFGTTIARHFEKAGVYSPNIAQAIVESRNKLCSLQLMASQGIPVPLTVFGHATSDVDDIIDAVGGAPLVVKVLEGTQGIGVVLCEQRNSARATIEAFRTLRGEVMVQEYIREASGEDLRCLVIGDEVVGAMVRSAASGEFRSNLHRGGSARGAKPSREESEIAIRAARAMRLRVAGVDILRSNRGPLVIEVNSSPGLQGIEAATGLDIAAKVITYVQRSATARNER